jgi:hypothetical protein
VKSPSSQSDVSFSSGIFLDSAFKMLRPMLDVLAKEKKPWRCLRVDADIWGNGKTRDSQSLMMSLKETTQNLWQEGVFVAVYIGGMRSLYIVYQPTDRHIVVAILRAAAVVGASVPPGSGREWPEGCEDFCLADNEEKVEALLEADQQALSGDVTTSNEEDDWEKDNRIRLLIAHSNPDTRLRMRLCLESIPLVKSQLNLWNIRESGSIVQTLRYTRKPNLQIIWIDVHMLEEEELLRPNHTRIVNKDLFTVTLLSDASERLVKWSIEQGSQGVTLMPLQPPVLWRYLERSSAVHAVYHR